MSELEQRLAGEPAGNWDSLRVGLIDRAEGANLIDLAYERHDSPFGTLLVFAGERGIVRIALGTEDEEEVLAGLARRISPRIVRAGRAGIVETRRQLDDYFAGERKHFELPLDWQLTKGFRREVLRHTADIPYGATASYADLADQAGSPKAVRAAGSALATNPLPIVIPCHRVLRSDGAVGSYLGGSPMKEALLEMERERAGS